MARVALDLFGCDEPPGFVERRLKGVGRGGNGDDGVAETPRNGRLSIGSVSEATDILG